MAITFYYYFKITIGVSWLENLGPQNLLSKTLVKFWCSRLTVSDGEKIGHQL